MNWLLILLLIIAGIGAIGGTISTILEVRGRVRIYEVLMKVCWIAFGLAGILVGILAALK